MAGLGGLPYYIQDVGALQQQQAQRQQMEFAKQEQQMRMFQFQQSQEAARRQQLAQQAAGQALPQLLAPPPAQQAQVPPPQPPMPGQPSQPMVQPGQMPPRPMPQGAPQGQPQAPLPPYRALPTAPVPQGAPGAGATVPPPPTQQPAAPQMQQPGGPLSFERAVQTLRAQGLEGADLMAGLAQLQPVLDTQAKLQNAQLQQQFNQEVKLSQLQQARDSLEERKREADARAADRKLALEDRQAARAESMAFRREMAQIKVGQARAGGDVGKLDADTLQFMAQQYWAGDRSVMQNLGRGAQGSQNIVALRKEIERQGKEQGRTGADLAAATAQFEGEKAGARTAGTKATNVELAAAEAQKTIGIARQLSEALPRTEFVPVNRALQSWQTNTGDPKTIAFGAALNTVINAYARAISPSGTPTVSDKEHARQMLSTANTKAQFDAVVNVMDQEMAAARKAPKEVQAAQRERISGKPEAPAGGIPAGWTVKER